jgi:hypothetical protein
MPKKKVIEPKIEKEVKTEFSVFTEQGDFVRTYSVEVHGNEADKLAEMYALKINGQVK